jgi:predicted esterase
MIVRLRTRQSVLHLGAAVEEASRAAILLHGRGSPAQAMRPLAEAIDVGDFSFLLPQAPQARWYPRSAFEPLELNEPDLSSALAQIGRLVDELHDSGIPHGKIVLGGFSQGACLASEYAARNATRYGGLFVLSGALIGPGGTPRDYPGSLAGTPVFIGSSDVDPWVPYDLVVDTAGVLDGMGASVDLRTYPGTAHTVVQDKVDAIHGLLAGV